MFIFCQKWNKKTKQTTATTKIEKTVLNENPIFHNNL